MEMETVSAHEAMSPVIAGPAVVVEIEQPEDNIPIY